MNELRKFKRNNPTNNEEKLICELKKNLDEVTHVFIQLNNPGIVTKEIFEVLRDGSIAYCGGMIRDLGKLLSNKNQIGDFIKEAKRIFNAYMNEIENNV